MTDKIGPQHRRRKVMLYVRQFSSHQVLHYRESRTLQYAMRERLQVLGFEQIEVVDEDLGRSAAGVVARAGFDRMVAERLARDGICVWSGHNYALEVVRHLRIEEAVGVVRIGLAHYNTASAIRRRQLHDVNMLFCRLSSACTALGTCFGAVSRATLGDLVGPWSQRSPVLRGRRPRVRSSFHDYAAERTHTPQAVRNKAEADYVRSDLFEKRRALMESWSTPVAYHGRTNPVALIVRCR